MSRARAAAPVLAAVAGAIVLGATLALGIRVMSPRRPPPVVVPAPVEITIAPAPRLPTRPTGDEMRLSIITAEINRLRDLRGDLLDLLLDRTSAPPPLVAFAPLPAAQRPFILARPAASRPRVAVTCPPSAWRTETHATRVR